MPRFDMLETADAYVLVFDLPGIAKEDVSLDIVGDKMLSIVAEAKQHPAYVAGAEFNYHERPVGKGARKVDLPPNADATRVEAKCENGVLEVKICKKQHTKKVTVDIQ